MIKLIFLFSKNTLNCLKVAVKTFIILQSISISNISHLNAVLLIFLFIKREEMVVPKPLAGQGMVRQLVAPSLHWHTLQGSGDQTAPSNREIPFTKHWLLRPGMHPHRQKFRIQHTVALNPHVKHKNDTA